MPDNPHNPAAPRDLNTAASTAAGFDLNSENDAMEHASRTEDPAELLHLATNHPSTGVHWNVANNDHASETTLHHLYEKYKSQPSKESEGVVDRVLSHHNAPASALHEKINATQPKDLGKYSFNYGHFFHPKAETTVVQRKLGELLGHPETPDDGKETLARQFIDSPHHHKEHVDYFVNRGKSWKNAVHALKSPHATSEHLDQFLNRPDVNESSSVKKTATSKAFDADKARIGEGKPSIIKSEKLNEMYDNTGDDPQRLEVAQHPNSPKELLLKHYAKGNYKKNALFAHPNFPMENVREHTEKALGLGGFEGDLFKHALGRKDLPEDLVVKMYDKFLQHKKEMWKYEKESFIPPLARHENLPLSAKQELAKTDIYAGRSLLGQKDLHPDILSALLKNKDPDIAVQAINHPGITAKHLEEAFKRKQKDVSAAAAGHPLATKQMKVDKLSDKRALPGLAESQDDPAFLAQVFEKGKDDPSVVQALYRNQNVTPDLLHKIIDHHIVKQKEAFADAALTDKARDAWRHRNFRQVKDHHSLEADHLLKLAPHHEGILENRKLGPDHIRAAIAHPDMDPDHKKEALFSALQNPNLDEPLAKEILTGQHGEIEKGYGNFANAMEENPQAFTPALTNQVLGTAHELTPHWAVAGMAESKHLTPGDISNHFANSFKVGEEGQNHPNAQHRRAMLNGFMKNPNTPSKVIGDTMFDDDVPGFGQHDQESLHDEAIAHPNLAPKDLKRAYSTEDGNHLPENKMVDQAEKRGMIPDLIKNGQPDAVRHLFDRAQHSKSILDVHPEFLQYLAQNPHPTAVRDILQKISRERGEFSEDQRKQLVDPFMAHADESVRDAAAPMASESKKAEMIAGADPKDLAKIIPILSDVKNLKINPGDPHDYVKRILEHRTASPEHLEAAIDHSAEGAKLALGKSRYTDNEVALTKKAFAKHPGNAGLLNDVIRFSNNSENVEHILNHPEFGEDDVRDLLNNEKLNTPTNKHVRKLTDQKHAPLMESLANRRKTGVDNLKHIMENYPQHAAAVAGHEKAGSPKLLPRLTKLAETDFDVKHKMARNREIPHDIREGYMADPYIALAVNPSAISNEKAHEILQGTNNPQILSNLLDANIDGDTASGIADKLMAHMPKNMADEISGLDAGKAAAAQALKSLIAGNAKNLITEDKRMELVKAHPSLAAHYIETNSGYDREQAGHQAPNIAPEKAMELMKMHNDHPHVARAMLHNSVSEFSPDVAKHLLDKLPELKDHDHSRLLQNLRGLDKRHLLDDDILKKTFDKVKHKPYNDMGRFLAREAGEDLQKEMIDYPQFYSSMVRNNRLGKESVKKISDFVLAPPISDPGSSVMSDPVNDGALQDYGPQLALNKAVDKDTRAKLVRALAAKDISWNDHGETRRLLKSSKLPKELLNELLPQPDDFGRVDADNTKSAAYENPNIDKEHLIAGIKNQDTRDNAVKNPKFRLSMLGEAFPNGVDEGMKQRFNKMVTKNFNAHPDDLREIAKTDQGTDLLNNPRLPKDVAHELANKLEIRGRFGKEDLYAIPSIGGDLFREDIKKEHSPSDDNHVGVSSFPEGLGLKSGNEVNEAAYFPSLDKVKDVAEKIPAGGFLDWASFKKENPGMAGDEVIQKMFTSAPKQRLTKEHAEKYMSEYPDAKKFGITYRKWNGMQIHNGKAQLVAQLNSSPEYEKIYQDPTASAIHQIVKNAQYSSSHPVNPTTIGWSRIDTNHPDHWFMDEAQSDYTSGLAGQLHNFLKYGGNSRLENEGGDPEQVEPSVRKLEQHSSGWDKALLNHLIEIAHKHGVKKISMHSGRSKTDMNKGEHSEVTHKYNRIYNKMPQEYGFKEDTYGNFPGSRPGGKLTENSPIWTADVAELAKKLKKSEGDELMEARHPGHLYTTVELTDILARVGGEFELKKSEWESRIDYLVKSGPFLIRGDFERSGSFDGKHVVNFHADPESTYGEREEYRAQANEILDELINPALKKSIEKARQIVRRLRGK